MYKSNLIKILQTFSPKEFREFGELVNSPFFNKSESTVKLYSYLKKYYPEFNAGDIVKEKVYGIIFDKAEYNDGFMRSVIFNLAELTESYLKQVNMKNDPARSELILLDELNKRKLEKEFNKNLPAAKKEIEKLKDRKSEYYFYKFLYQQTLNSYINWSRYKNKNLKDNYEPELAKENKYLSEYMLIKTLGNYRNFSAKLESINVEYNSGFLDDLIRYITENPGEFKEAPSVMLHANEVLLLRTKEERYYRLLKEQLINGVGTQDERYSLLNILQSYCVYRFFKGDSEFSAERFRLYKAAIESNFYRGTEDIYFDALLFPNIGLAALKQGEFKWAEEFINKYKNEMPPDEKDVITGYLEGRLHFETGNYNKAIKTIEAIKNTRHLQYKVIIRNLLLLLYFELGNFDKAESFYNSYRQYLSKNEKQFAPQRFERFTDFMRYYQLLLKIYGNRVESLNGNNFTADTSELEAELKNNTNVIERDWLINKVNKLKK